MNKKIIFISLILIIIIIIFCSIFCFKEQKNSNTYNGIITSSGLILSGSDVYYGESSGGIIYNKDILDL